MPEVTGVTPLQLPADKEADRVETCLASNSLGDGILFGDLHRGLLLYNKSAGEWFVWGGHYWKRDIMNAAYAAVENVALLYARHLAFTETQAAKASKDDSEYFENKIKQYKRRIDRLRSTAGRQACLDFAHTAPGAADFMAVSGEHFDSQKHLFACANGVINLKTGQLRDGRPEDYITKASPVEYKGMDEPCPKWDKFLKDSVGDDESIKMLQLWAGYCMTGETIEHKCLWLTGLGRNGKGVWNETLAYISGDYARPASPEILLDQGRNKSASAPSPEIMSLKGTRHIYISESDDGRKVLMSQYKRLVSSDKLEGRNPHDKYPIAFAPTHKATICTNHEPFMDPDPAAKARTMMLRLEHKFVKNPDPKNSNEKQINKQLPDELLDEEASGIFGWAVKGSVMWYNSEVYESPRALQYKDEFFEGQDILLPWLEQNCVQGPNMITTATTLYENFSEWWERYQSKKVPSMTWFGKKMKLRFGWKKNGVMQYEGVGLLA